MDGGPYLLSVAETDAPPKNMRQRKDHPCRHPGTVSDDRSSCNSYGQKKRPHPTHTRSCSLTVLILHPPPPPFPPPTPHHPTPHPPCLPPTPGISTILHNLPAALRADIVYAHVGAYLTTGLPCEEVEQGTHRSVAQAIPL